MPIGYTFGIFLSKYAFFRGTFMLASKRGSISHIKKTLTLSQSQRFLYTALFKNNCFGSQRSKMKLFLEMQYSSDQYSPDSTETVMVLGPA